MEHSIDYPYTWTHGYMGHTHKHALDIDLENLITAITACLVAT